MKVKLQEIIDAIGYTHDSITYYLDLKTGDVVLLIDEDDEDIELSEMLENEPERFLNLPDLYNDEYHFMEKFVYSLPSGDTRNQLINAIDGTGAFRMFRYFINHFNLEDDWYKFRGAILKEIASSWCKSHELDYE